MSSLRTAHDRPWFPRPPPWHSAIAAHASHQLPPLPIPRGVVSQVIDESLRGCKQPTSYCYPPSSVPANGTASGNTTANGTLTTSPCDLKVFVTWTGTDSNGKFLTSAGRRFSRYRQYGTASVYQGALNVVDSSVNLGNRALSELSDVPGRVAPGLNRNLRESEAEGVHGDAAAVGATTVAHREGLVKVKVEA